MQKKWVAALLAIVIAPMIWGRTIGDEAAQSSLGSRGDVDTGGVVVTIPGLFGSTRVTYTVIVANDDDTDNLLVATDVSDASPTGMPAPPSNIQTMGKVLVLLPGEKLSLDQGAQAVGLRAETGTVATRLIVTRR